VGKEDEISRAVQQRKIKSGALCQLADGLVLMRGLYGERGSGVLRSFVQAPFVSELLSVYVFAAKKTSETISISFSTLIRASRDKTFCLGILIVCMAIKRSPWDYLS
jgi:hypothetical protein